MYTAYLICFLSGATLMAFQFLFSLLGFGDHHGVDGHDFHAGDGHDGHGGDHGADEHGDQYVSWFVGVLTFRSLVAAVTFFGLVGLATHEYLEAPRSLLVAGAAGVGALYLVAFLMRTLHRLRAEGTAHIARSVGKNGTVYLTIPGQKAGLGKVTLTLQNRTVEYQAVTLHQTLPTGAPVVVTAVVSPDTVEVALATDSGSTGHA